MNDSSRTSIFDLLLLGKPAVEEISTSIAIEATVTELFEQFRRGMLRYIGSLGLSVHDGEEIVQEVFLLLFQHLCDRKPQENLRGWLFRVAHNLALKRRIANQAATKTTCCISADEHHDPRPSPEDHLFFQQRRDRLLSVLHALPERDQCCLYLRAEGLQYREIAGVLDISLGSVSKSLARAIRRLSNADRW
jgi:RNA polymerase sigma-70 factor (ECF subfamily)